MIIDNARVFWEAGGFVRQKIITEDGIISECTHDNSGFDASGMYILPGLVDIHLHGALGYDFSDHTKEALLAIEKYGECLRILSFFFIRMPVAGFARFVMYEQMVFFYEKE